MGFWARIFGICQTGPPADKGCWRYGHGTVTIDLDRAPELSEAGGAIRLEGDGLPVRVLVVNGGDGRFHVYRNKCTHGGRRLDPQPGQDQLQCCSVGKSVFHYAGHPLSGPAKGRLEVYPLDKQGANLVIRL